MFCGNSPNNHSLVVLAFCIPHPSEIPSKSQDGILLINTWAHIIPHACYAKKDREGRKCTQHLRLHTDVHQKKGQEMELPISETTYPWPVNELLSPSLYNCIGGPRRERSENGAGMCFI